MKITADDFTRINLGVYIATIGATEFIIQEPLPADKKRAAQTTPVLIIDGKIHEVATVQEALDKCNDYLDGGS